MDEVSDILLEFRVEDDDGENIFGVLDDKGKLSFGDAKTMKSSLNVGSRRVRQCCIGCALLAPKGSAVALVISETRDARLRWVVGSWVVALVQCARGGVHDMRALGM
ncbi:hypothetical protein ACLB2K_059878 [Fragaria x ananassa]